MKDLIHSVELSLEQRNWYAALTVVLTLPDIAGKVEYPTASGSQKRYADWFEQYCSRFFTAEIGTSYETKFLSGNDCYALRCSFLHEGLADTGHQRARDILNEFQFIVADRSSNHLDILGLRSNGKLVLQVDRFCEKIIRGIRQWLDDIEGDEQKQEQLRKFLAVTDIVDSNGIMDASF